MNFFLKGASFSTILENSLIKKEQFSSGSSDFDEKSVLIKCSVNFDSSNFYNTWLFG